MQAICFFCVTSQLLDTLIFGSIALYWGPDLPLEASLRVMGSTYAFKVALALLDTPFCCAGVGVARR